VPPRLALLRAGEAEQVHLRWRPGSVEVAAAAPETVSA
jgi:hypothetical protein